MSVEDSDTYTSPPGEHTVRKRKSMMNMRSTMTEPRCRGSPAVVSMIMARRGMAKNNNHIRQKGIKSQSRNNSEKVKPREEKQSKKE